MSSLHSPNDSKPVAQAALAAETTGGLPPSPQPLPRSDSRTSISPTVCSEKEKNNAGDQSAPNAPPPTGDTQDANVIVVDWDGPEDPANPRNWPAKQKWAAAITVSAFTFISPIASSMVAPAVQQVAEDLGIHSSFEVGLTISIFVLAYAFGPLFLAPTCEVFGRTPVLRGANLFFFAWNLGCGFAQNKGQLIAFRFLAGLGGSAPLAAGGAVLGDLWTPEERGKAISIYALAPLLGPVIGPVAGGWIAERSTWRWVFWSTSAAAMCVQALGIFFLQETYAPVLLDKKAKKIRASLDAEAGGATKEVRTIYQKSSKRNYRELYLGALWRPCVMFVLEPIIQLLGLYVAFLYGLIYLVLTTVPGIFSSIYHDNPGIIGLHYISLGLGLYLGTQINAQVMDRVYRVLKERNNGVGEPEFRLPCTFPAVFLVPAGLLIAGWGAQEHVHWIVPDIGFALIGMGLTTINQCMTTYIIDAFAQYAASALAAFSFLRSIAGFGFPLFANAMYEKLGYGKGDTVLAAIALAIGIPASYLFWVYGKKIRALSKHAK